jgi:hypothetical protein
MLRSPLLACLLGALLPAQDYNDWLTKFNGALASDDVKVLDRAMKEAPHHLLGHFEQLVRERLFTRQSDEELKQRITKVKGHFQRVFETETLDHFERWLSRADSKTIELYDKNRDNLNKLYGIKATAIAERNRRQMETAKSQATEIAGRFSEYGMPLKASEAWAMVAEIVRNLPEVTIDERKDAVFAIEQFDSCRKEWAWTKDVHYLHNVNWMKAEKDRIQRDLKEAEKRKAAGYTEDAKGADALVMPNVAEVTTQLEFKPLAALQDDLFVKGGPTPALWMAAAVTDNGPSKMHWFTRKEVFLVWEGGQKYGVTLNGGEPDLKKNRWEPVQAGNKLKPSLFHLGPDGKSLPYAMWFYLPGDSEPVMGLSQNLAPLEKTADQARSATIFYKSAASWVATIAGEQVTFYDDNANGKLFEEDAYAYNLKDRTQGDPTGEGIAVPAYDSMRIGKGGLMPFSAFVPIAGKWYHVRTKDDGLSVGVRPLNPEFFKTGTLQVKWTAPPTCKLESLVVRGRGQYAAASFNLVGAGGKPVEVPAGEYEIAFGRVGDGGKGPTAVHGCLFKGNSRTLTVEAGKPATLSLGAPFLLEWQRDGSETEAKIDSLRMRIVGQAGEVYARINGATPAPEVLVGKSKDGKGAKVAGQFVAMQDSETLNKLNSKKLSEKIELRLDVGFFPIVKGEKEPTTVLTVPLAGKDLLIALVQRQHKLFGKLDPVWK